MKSCGSSESASPQTHGAQAVQLSFRDKLAEAGLSQLSHKTRPLRIRLIRLARLMILVNEGKRFVLAGLA